MPRWEYCSKCGKAYNPNELTAEQRLMHAIFREQLCPECDKHRDPQVCTKCTKEVLALVYYENEPYHSKCLAEILGQ